MSIDYKDFDFAAAADEVNPEFRKRAALLADFMEALAPEDHKQSSWMEAKLKDNHYCATPHCALGWAIAAGFTPGATVFPAISVSEAENHEATDAFAKLGCTITDGAVSIEGLTHEAVSELLGWGVSTFVHPLLNGEDSEWEEIGCTFFGDAVYNEIFGDGYVSKNDLVAKLRHYAEHGYVKDDHGCIHAIVPEDSAVGAPNYKFGTSRFYSEAYANAVYVQIDCSI